MSVLFIPLWFLMSIGPSFAYAISNHLDKHQLKKWFLGEFAVATMLVISAFVSVVAIPFLLIGGWMDEGWLFFLPEKLSHLRLFVLVGVLHVLLVWLYLKALKGDDTIVVIILYSFLPVLGALLSRLVLGETLVYMQYVAMGLVMLGVLIVTIKRHHEKGTYHFAPLTAVLMFFASFCWAFGDVLFKYVAIDTNIWQALFWEHVILTVIGIAMYRLRPAVRKELKVVWSGEHGRKIISITLLSEFLYIAGNVISAFPLMEVDVAAVQMVEAIQLVWVFLIALFLWALHSIIARLRGVESTHEGFTRAELIQKGLASAFAIYGMYLLAVHTPV